MDKEFYTELIYRYKCIEDYAPTEISFRKAQWDMSLDNLLEMFHCICIGATWSEESFEDALAEYLESRGYQVIDKDEHLEESE